MACRLRPELSNLSPVERPLPSLAAVAKPQGEYVGEVVRRRLCNKPAIGPFSYRDRGTLATIGRNSAVADLPWAKLTGILACLFWGRCTPFC